MKSSWRDQEIRRTAGTRMRSRAKRKGGAELSEEEKWLTGADGLRLGEDKAIVRDRMVVVGSVETNRTAERIVSLQDYALE